MREPADKNLDLQVERLEQEIRASGVVHGDETGWRENGRNGYLWSFSTPKVRYLLYRPSRGGAVVEEVLGEEFDGVLVSDFYGAYNVYQGPHQRCTGDRPQLGITGTQPQEGMSIQEDHGWSTRSGSESASHWLSTGATTSPRISSLPPSMPKRVLGFSR